MFVFDFFKIKIYWFIFKSSELKILFFLYDYCLMGILFDWLIWVYVCFKWCDV